MDNLNLIQCCGIAARKLNVTPISAFTDGTKQAQVFSTQWYGVLSRCLDADLWFFTLKTEELGNLTVTEGAPADPRWTRKFQIGADYRRLVRVMDSSGSEITDWTIEGDKLFANIDRVILKYSRDYTEDTFPTLRTWFQTYFCSSLAYEAAPALTAVDADVARLLGETQAALKAAQKANAREFPGGTLPVGHLRAVRTA